MKFKLYSGSELGKMEYCSSFSVKSYSLVLALYLKNAMSGAIFDRSYYFLARLPFGTYKQNISRYPFNDLYLDASSVNIRLRIYI